MIHLALILIAVALVDGLALFPRTAPGQRGAFLAVAVLAIAAAALSHAAYPTWHVTLLTFFTLSSGTLTWSSLRNDPEGGRGWLAITALVAMLAIGAFLIPVLTSRDPGEQAALLRLVAAYLEHLPWYTGNTSDPELLLLVVGLLLFLGPTANAVVKTVMTQIRNFNYDASEQQLKGGRYIGPLERWLIFGLALAGQPTAAALVISAKSIIRFPELQSKAEQRKSSETATADGRPLQQIDELTEYFLIGSLLSWLLALLAALPIAAVMLPG